MTARERAESVVASLRSAADIREGYREDLFAAVEQAIARAVEEEREACAVVADDIEGGGEWFIVAQRIAARIRARSGKA